MKRLKCNRPSPSLVLSLVALFVALGGTGYAAIMLPVNSVGTAQIKTRAVVSSKVRNGSLLRADFKAGQLPLGMRGYDSGQGPVAPAAGKTADSNAVVSTLAVPAGKYAITARAQAVNTSTTVGAQVECTVFTADRTVKNVDTAGTILEPAGSANAFGSVIALQGTSTVVVPSSAINMTCATAATPFAGSTPPEAPATIYAPRIQAVLIGPRN